MENIEKPAAHGEESDLKKLVIEYIEWLDSDEYHEDGDADRTHYIFETAMEHYFGKDVWERINNRHE